MRMIGLRMKRRRPPASYSGTSDLPRLGSSHTLTRPLPSGSPPTIRGVVTDAVSTSDKAFHHAWNYPPQKKRRGSAGETAVAERVGNDGREGEIGGEFGSMGAGNGNQLRRHQVSKNALAGMSSSLIPKLALLPQEVRPGFVLGFLVLEVKFD